MRPTVYSVVVAQCRLVIDRAAKRSTMRQKDRVISGAVGRVTVAQLLLAMYHRIALSRNRFVCCHGSFLFLAMILVAPIVPMFFLMQA